jgi:hypothetical protein
MYRGGRSPTAGDTVESFKKKGEYMEDREASNHREHRG